MKARRGLSTCLEGQWPAMAECWATIWGILASCFVLLWLHFGLLLGTVALYFGLPGFPGEEEEESREGRQRRSPKAKHPPALRARICWDVRQDVRVLKLMHIRRLHTCIDTCMYVYIYIWKYTYAYTSTGRERERERERARDKYAYHEAGHTLAAPCSCVAQQSQFPSESRAPEVVALLRRDLSGS